MRERERPKAVLELTEVDREILAGYRRRRKTAQGLAVRSAIVLSCARGLDNNVVAARLSVSPRTVGKWRSRFIALGIDGLLDEPRYPVRLASVSDKKVEQVVTLTLESKPKGATHWSTRQDGETVGAESDD